MRARVIQGDCLERMAELESASLDAIVTDPPYGLAFMGKAWDHGAPGVPFWSAALRVAKPGAHLLAFGGTRTYHRLTCAIEDAGWEIRDCLSWLYGSGFPKSLDVSKAIDKAAGAERPVVGIAKGTGRQNPAWNGTEAGRTENSLRPEYAATISASAAARQWEGWGTALKPAWEPIILARKPLNGTVVANVQQHGTGALNIDRGRIRTGSTERSANIRGVQQFGGTNHRPHHDGPNEPRVNGSSIGRWPANVVLDAEAAELLDEQSGEHKGGAFPSVQNTKSWKMSSQGKNLSPARSMGDSGGASRFFYTAKASRSEREAMESSEQLPTRRTGTMQDDAYEWPGTVDHSPHRTPPARNHHPTVKPLDLMRWLVRLVTPPNGLILDPFCGSGTTGCAALAEGFRFIGIEREPEYVAIAEARLNATQPALSLDVTDG